MNGLWDALLYAFCVKVVQGKAKPHECEFFARLAESHGFGEERRSDADWENAVSRVSEAVSLSEFTDDGGARPMTQKGSLDCVLNTPDQPTMDVWGAKLRKLAGLEDE